jgi:hypothetical protein
MTPVPIRGVRHISTSQISGIVMCCFPFMLEVLVIQNMWGEKDYFMILEGELRYLDVDLYYNS